MVWKCKNFLKIEYRGHKRVNWWAREQQLAWKKGVMTVAYAYPFPMWVPPHPPAGGLVLKLQPPVAMLENCDRIKVNDSHVGNIATLLCEPSLQFHS